jgi:hypothetical protein
LTHDKYLHKLRFIALYLSCHRRPANTTIGTARSIVVPNHCFMNTRLWPVFFRGGFQIAALLRERADAL